MQHQAESAIKQPCFGKQGQTCINSNVSAQIINHPEHSAKINNMCKHQTKQDLKIALHKTN